MSYQHLRTCHRMEWSSRVFVITRATACQSATALAPLGSECFLQLAAGVSNCRRWVVGTLR